MNAKLKYVGYIGIIILGILAIVCGIALLLAWFTQLIWNAVMPDVFNLPTITFWQAFLLQLLSNILIRSHPNYLKKKD